MGLGFKFMISCLQNRCSTAWATPPVHFILVILEMEFLANYLPRLALNHDPPDLSLLVARIIGMSY
jgi:hypothetical protein